MTTIPYGMILQTQRTSLKTASSISAGPAAYTQGGPTVTITPKKSTSRIRITGRIAFSASDNGLYSYVLYRDGVAIADAIGNARGTNRERVTGSNSPALVNRLTDAVIDFDDFPGDTSAHTYDVRWSSFNAAQTIYFNRAVTDSDTNAYFTAQSELKAEEISQ